MNRLEKELKVLEALGLKEGDKVKFSNSNGAYQIIKEDDRVSLNHPNLLFCTVDALIINDWKKVRQLGDKHCSEIDDCDGCPLRFIQCDNCNNVTLFEQIDIFKKRDAELYEFLHKRLENEVVANDN